MEGLSHSCNYFFYTLGDRLGETRLYQYAANFGFTSKTGIDLPGEVRSVVGCQTSLYDPDKAMDEASQDTSMPHHRIQLHQEAPAQSGGQPEHHL